MHFNNVVDTKTSACFDVINILCYHVTLTLHFTIMPFVENWNKHVVHQHLKFKFKYLAIRYMSFHNFAKYDDRLSLVIDGKSPIDIR